MFRWVNPSPTLNTAFFALTSPILTFSSEFFIFSYPQGITFLAHPVMLSFSIPTLVRIDYLTSKRNLCLCVKQARSWDYCLFYASPLSVSLCFTFLKLFFIYTVCSPHFIHSPWFIPSLQSVVCSPQSAVRVLYLPISISNINKKYLI